MNDGKIYGTGPVTRPDNAFACWLRVRWTGRGNGWKGGRTHECAAWGYDTPWGALHGSWRLHRTFCLPWWDREHRACYETAWGWVIPRGRLLHRAYHWSEERPGIYLALYPLWLARGKLLGGRKRP